MKRALYVLSSAAVFGLVIWPHLRRPGDSSQAQVVDGPEPVTKSTAAPAATPGIAVTTDSPPSDPQSAPPAVVPPRKPDLQKIQAFQNWMEQWKAAAEAKRQGLIEEGVRLARERRPEFKALIVTDPKSALEMAVPRVVRQALPVAIVDELETPVSAVGEYSVLYGYPTPARPGGSISRAFSVNDMHYNANVFGDLDSAQSFKRIPLRGVAVDEQLAVHPNAVRPVETGEIIPAGVTIQNVCPVSKKTTETVSSGNAVTENTPTVEIGGSYIGLCSGWHVNDLQEQFRTYVQASGTGGSGFFFDNFPGTAAKSIGNLRCLYIRAIYPDEMTPPNTEQEAYEDMSNVAKFYADSSYGKLVMTTQFTSLIMLPHTKKWYMDRNAAVSPSQTYLGLIHTEAQAEAKKQGYDPALFDCIVLRVNGGLLDSSSWGGGSRVWAGWGGMGVLAHECGHSLGLGHARYWNTTDGTAYGNGTSQDYGNPFDQMGGGGGFNAHFNVISKQFLSWLTPAYVHTPTTNGVYRIHAYDQPRLEEGKRYALKVAKDATKVYHLEYHPAMGGALSTSALVIGDGYGGGNAGNLFDTTPGSLGGKNDGGIAIGRTYSDWESDQHFTVVSKGGTNPPYLDIAYNKGPFPGNMAPVIASLEANATTIAVNGSVTFTANASDANGDPLAYYWQFSDGQEGSNGSSFTRSFTAADQVTAMCTVSDMKGGTARASVVIDVGTHGKKKVTGTVAAGETPLAGVYISGGGEFCYSNSDGTYALTGLANGSVTLSATIAGYTLVPAFANPITITADVPDANWNAAQAGNFVTLSKIADAAEGGANGTFRITRTGDTTAALTVLVPAAKGTATKTTDYTFSPDYAVSGSNFSFTIPAGAATLDITVAAVNDAAAEGPETIALQIVSATGYWCQSGNAVNMTVVDDDTTLPQVAIIVPNPYAQEGSGGNAGTFILSRTGSTTAALDVSMAWTGTATLGADYTTLPATVTIPAGQSSTNVVVNPIDDSAVESSETVVATVNAAAAYVRDTEATTATMTITDDETPYVFVSVPDSSASEEGLDSGVFAINRTGSTASPLTVYYGVAGTASHGTDYQPLTGQVTIPAGSVSAPVVIMPYNDDSGEPEETVTLTLTTLNNVYSTGVPNSGTLSIKDNDGPVVSVRPGAGTEGGANATIIFKSVGTGSGNVTVNYTVSGTATAGSDYTALSGTVSVPVNGTNETVVTIPVINDTLAEATETVVVTLAPGSGYLFYNDTSATALIHDNDSGADRVVVSTNENVPSESGLTSGTFYFSRTGTTGNITVNYAVSGTATSDADYTALSGTCVIPDGQSAVSVTLTPIDDTEAEGVETVTVTVTPGTGYSPGYPASATYQITDNDAPAITVAFQSTVLATSEKPGALGEYRDLTVILSAASASTIKVTCAANGGDATGDDVDWAFVDPANGNAVIPYPTLIFPPGVTTQTVRIRIKDDGIAEPGESVILALTNPVGVALHPSRASFKLVIFDDSVGNLVTEERWNTGTVYTNNTWNTVNADYTSVLTSFTAPQNVAENFSRRMIGQIVAPATGTYNFWIASDDASRLYLSTDSTAANKAQIASLSGWTDFQNWDANSSQKSVNINLVAGQSYYLEVQHQEGGGGDHVSVAWQGPGFARTPITMPPPADTAPRYVRFVIGGTTRYETDGSEPLLMVTLDRPAGNTPITVDYTTDGTATAGSDYILPSGTVTFAPGEQMKLLPLAILADSIGEAPEAVVVTLANPTGAQMTAPVSHTITILDADAPVVATRQFTAATAMSAGTVIGTMSATVTSGRTVAGWTILAGNAGNVFGINASGQVTLLAPGALPNPGPRQLLVRATDSAGATGDGIVSIACNPPAYPVTEQRWSGATPYNSNTWTGTPVYSGSLETFTTPQGVADNYSRRLVGYIQPQTTGSYTFWIASDDASRLFLSTDETAAHKGQIATVSGYTGFQSWDSQGTQKSIDVTLQAGMIYYMEVNHLEGGGGDHASVAWSGPGFSREPIPASALFPNAFGTPPSVPSIAITSPAHGSSFPAGSNVTVNASVVGGSVSITSVDFYDGATLVASDTTAPYSASLSNLASGTHTLTARAVSAGGAVNSSAVTITGLAPWATWQQTKFGANAGNAAIAGEDADPDWDGLNNLLEYSTNSNPLVVSAQPQVGMEPGFLTLTYRRNLAATDVTYEVMQSDALTAWSVATVTAEILSDDGITRVIKAKVAINAETRKFLRLRVTRN